MGKTSTEPPRPDETTEHPHARGENAGRKTLFDQTRGTSPRTWGKQHRHRNRLRSSRNIPTHVGKTLHPLADRALLSEHPHARGENVVTDTDYTSPNGTSPRTWGKHEPPGPRFLSRRNIPTHVGKTRLPWPPASQGTEHPHARGENFWYSE